MKYTGEDEMRETASRLRRLIRDRYNLSGPMIRMLESGRMNNMNVERALAKKGLIEAKIVKTPTGIMEVEDLLGISQEGEDVAGALRFTARVLKENAS